MIRFIFSLLLLLLVFVQYSLARTAPTSTQTKDASQGSTAANAPERTVIPVHVASSKTTQALCSHIEHAASAVKSAAQAGTAALEGHLARLTAYWSGEGDYYTRHHISSTGVHLHEGHCAVDPKVIPYGSIVQIPGLGNYLAVDTGTAVVSRQAAREAGHNRDQRNALVVDLYFENRHDGEKFASLGAKYASITWSKPSTGEEIEVGAAKTHQQIETQQAAAKAVKIAAKEEPKIIAAKSSGKKDVKVTATKTPAKEDAQVVTKKSSVKNDAGLASAKPASKGAKKTSSEQGMLAEDSGSAHHKALYAF